jgi:hypothetical protein
MGIDDEYCEISYGGGGSASLAVGDCDPRIMELSEGENRPRPWPKECCCGAVDWKPPYGAWEVCGGCHMLVGVYGGTDPLLELGAMEETGLRPSDEPLLGGVSRLPTLLRVVGTGAGCAYECVGYFCCRLASGGGGSSNVPN